MCGIAGDWRADGTADAGLIAVVLARLAHRGPDGSRIERSGLAVLGHHRLAIQDPTPGGMQPLISPDGDLALVVNGEIHNAPELRRREDVRGWPFRGASDSELLLPLWRRLGPACLPLLRGPFALAVSDRRSGALFLARDRLGKKPLFLHRRAGRVLFASEAAALLPALPARSWSLARAAAFLQAGYVPGTATLVDELEELGPGSLLVADGSGIRTRTWWSQPDGEHAGLTAETARERLRGALRAAVMMRTATDLPLGVLLSGGLDSAAVLHAAQETLGRPLPAWTVAFDDAAFDESGTAALTAQALGAEHRIVRFDRDPGETITDLVRTSGEALADASWIPTAFACEQASRDVRILLTGDGGDETLLGYRRHAAAGFAARRIPRRLRPACARLAVLAPTSGTARFLRGLARGHTAGFLGAVESLVAPDTLRRELVPGLLGEPDPLTVACMLAQGAAPDGAATAGRIDLAVQLPGDLLPKADRASMRHGVEIRSPFLDTELVSQMLAVPGDLRLPGLRTKALLRDLLRGRVPEAIVEGRKRGFGVPLASWFRRGSYGTFADTLLGDLTAPFAGLLAAGTARPLLLRLRAGEDGLAPLVHACVVLALWHDAFMRAG